MIPKIAHRIWFGEPFPDKYKDYFKEFVRLNPKHVVNLWIDSQSMSNEYFAQLKEWCSANNIIPCDIQENPDLANFDLISEELNKASKNPSRKRLHYVRASDIARVAILKKYGGVHIDTDSKSLKPLPEFNAKKGILFKLFGSKKINLNCFPVVLSEKYRWFFSDILYDFIASEPETELLNVACEVIKHDYKTYHSSKNTSWENSDNAQDLLYGTVKLTGTALKRALNYLHQTGRFSFNDPTDIFFDCSEISKDDYDKSWLEGFEILALPTDPNLEKFREEIETSRNHIFPIKNHGDHPYLREDIIEEASENTRDYNYNFPNKEFSFADITKMISKDEFKEELSSESFPKPHYQLPDIKIVYSDSSKLNLNPISPPAFQLDLNLQPIKLEIPNFKLQKLNLSNFKFNILTPEKVKEIYEKNGGSWFASFSIFRKNKTLDEIIATLKQRERENTNSDSASRKTLSELNLEFPNLKIN